MTVVRVRSHPGLSIQDCLQALPLVPWALSSSSCVLWFPLPLVLKILQYICINQLIFFFLLLLWTIIPSPQFTLRFTLGVVQQCMFMQYTVLFGTLVSLGLCSFGVCGAGYDTGLLCLWEKWQMLMALGHLRGHGDWWQMACVHHDIYVKHVGLPRDEKLLTLAQQAWYSFRGLSLRKINPTVTTQRDKKDHMTVFHW